MVSTFCPRFLSHATDPPHGLSGSTVQPRERGVEAPGALTHSLESSQRDYRFRWSPSHAPKVAVVLTEEVFLRSFDWARRQLGIPLPLD
jgi:hypothetical protein